MRKHVRLAAGVALAASLAACGTTVPVAQQGLTNGKGLGDGLGTSSGGEGTSNSQGESVGASAAGTATSGAHAAGTAAGSSGRVSGAGSQGSATGSSTPRALSATARPILVGITYVKDAAAGFQAIGVQGATLGDMQLYAQSYVDDANAHGGLAGRKIVPVFFGYDVNPGSQTYPQQDQQACAAFTQDKHVEVAISNFAGDDLRACLHSKGIPMVEDGPTGGISAGSLRKNQFDYVLGGLNLDRRATELTKALPREKYFTGWNTSGGSPGPAPVKVGVITYDLPDYRESVSGPLTRGLVAAGYAPTKAVYVAAHDSYDDLSKMQPQLSNAVVAFRAAGITHVIIYDDNGVASLFFMNAADNQGYRPRYGITSGNNMQTLAKLVHARQLVGSIGIGWDPPFDVPDAKSPTSRYSNSARRSCYALMQKDHVSNGSGFNENSEMMYCATVRALKNRADTLGQFSAQGLIAAFNAYGAGFVDPQVPSTWLSPTQHDGAGGVYDYLYDGSCSCMKYAGGIHYLTRG